MTESSYYIKNIRSRTFLFVIKEGNILNRKALLKIALKILSSIILLILVLSIVIVLTNIPIDLNFYRINGKIESNFDYASFKENVIKSINLLISGEIFEQRVIGKSENVGVIMKTSLKRSMTLFIFALALAVAIGIPKGIFDSRRKNKNSNFKLLLTLIPLSVPDVLTISLVQLLGFYLYKRNISIFGLGTIMHIGYENWTQSIYPIIALSLVPAAYIARTTASSIEVVYDRDYILTARGKGCSESRIIRKHIMPNILTDLIGAFPAIASILFSSLFIVERLFYYPGVAFEMLAYYRNPKSDGSSTILFLGLAVGLALIYFLIYTSLDIATQVIIPKLKNE